MHLGPIHRFNSVAECQGRFGIGIDVFQVIESFLTSGRHFLSYSDSRRSTIACRNSCCQGDWASTEH